MLRCQGFEVKHYDFTLRRLAYESLRLVQNPGDKPQPGQAEKNSQEGTKTQTLNIYCNITSCLGLGGENFL